MIVVRAAEAADLDQVLVVADRARRRNAGFAPQFWRPAADAVERQRAYLSGLLPDPGTLFAVACEDEDPASVRGFLVARVAPAPPVYDPGGPTCVVDDFAVADPAWWEVVGPPLLASCRAWAAGRGSAQLVVVTAARDKEKRAVLGADDLRAASEWWVGPVTAPTTPPPHPQRR